MKIFLTFIVLLFSVFYSRAQDTTKYGEFAPFLEYGIDNNNWSSLNQILTTNGYHGNFSSIQYERWGVSFVFRKRKRSDIELNWCFSGQSFTASNRSYNCNLVGFKLLGHYNF